MKKIIILICSIIIMGLLLFPIGCKKTDKPESAKEKISKPSLGEPGFNPDEPAPVPEGTPEY